MERKQGKREIGRGGREANKRKEKEKRKESDEGSKRNKASL